MLASVALGAASLLPINEWMPGGGDVRLHTAPIEGWLYGTLSAVLIGVLLAIVWSRIGLPWREGFWADLGRRADEHPRRTSLLLAVTALAGYAAVSTWTFHRSPLLMDCLHDYQAGRRFPLELLTDYPDSA